MSVLEALLNPRSSLQAMTYHSTTALSSFPDKAMLIHQTSCAAHILNPSGPDSCTVVAVDVHVFPLAIDVAASNG